MRGQGERMGGDERNEGGGDGGRRESKERKGKEVEAAGGKSNELLYTGLFNNSIIFFKN